MIQLTDVSVKFKQGQRQIVAVENASLEVKKGEIYGIVGYSGAGKSTLVRTINFLQVPTQGQVLVAGQDLAALTPSQLRQARKKIGMIFQQFNLMESRTIFDNVAFPLKGSSLTKSQIADKVNALLDLVGLADKAKGYPDQLSGGQKQRVAIARALANDPEVLLCDEATSALDPKTTQDILALLRRINQEMGVTMVVITHEMAVVKDLCHKVAVMENGRIIEQGPILEVFTNPQQALTQEFIQAATHLDQELKTVFDYVAQQGANAPGQIAQITYIGQATMEPFVARLTKQFNIETNILSGHIEIIEHTPVGNLLVSFSGQLENLVQAVEFLTKEGIQVKILDPQEAIKEKEGQ
ncbi:methionine ABC transporter ATP-binding protein [Vaginisenegalia massiliensis]|uniref:methionine ABC transporter ATP-binding protein n=1 Tax=Vaginisenegalia massiliensis TaxID=2058294 RepID=UPI000F525DC8|nr:ATP-binding cassette domain-containing protein [Vaginisenegalia massiliensis]